ncbi:MAG: nuclear transport factor 2 family protein [Sulfitobacter sp.]
MTRDVIEQFWATMATNDFDAASTLLSPDFEYYMPQSQEYLTGRASFAGLNKTYPAQGAWTFDVRSLVVEAQRAVSEVAISDGVMKATAVTFHWVRDGFIWRQVEYWPDPYEAPGFRSKWTKVVDRPPF